MLLTLRLEHAYSDPNEFLVWSALAGLEIEDARPLKGYLDIELANEFILTIPNENYLLASL
jgi:hypothetical protein